MNLFWKILLAVAVLVLAMVLITLFVPDVRAEAARLATDRHLPIWLAALVAPVAYAFKRLFDHTGGTTGAIVEENRKLREEQAKLRQDVAVLVAWRERELETRRAEIARLQTDIAALRDGVADIQGRFRSVAATPLPEFAHQLDARGEMPDLDDFLHRTSGKEFE